jgi:hypothetical protein
MIVGTPVSNHTQDLTFTFTATGEANGIVSVTALIMRTNRSLTIPSVASLILRLTAGISQTTAPSCRMVMFPNSSPGDSRVVLGLTGVNGFVIAVKLLKGHAAGIIQVN